MYARVGPLILRTSAPHPIHLTKFMERRSLLGGGHRLRIRRDHTAARVKECEPRDTK